MSIKYDINQEVLVMASVKVQRVQRVQKKVIKDREQFEILMQLAALKPHIRAYDFDFAKSLVDNFNKYGKLSDKQMWHVKRLINETSQIVGSQTPVQNATPSVTPYVNFAELGIFFANAGKSGKKSYKMNLIDPNLHQVILKSASVHSKYHGQTFISNGETVPHNKYYGRITQSGDFIPSKTGQLYHHDLVGLLTMFNKDPLQTAKDYGKLTGTCCFCMRHLEDEKSVQHGYGPICAKRFVLPY